MKQVFLGASFTQSLPIKMRKERKVASDAVQELRIKYRWEAIDQENKARQIGKEVGKPFKPHILENGDTPKQLLARSRYQILNYFKKRA